MSEYTDKADRLEEIKDEIDGLINEAAGLLRGTGIIESRAKAYWLAWIESMLSGRETCTMQDTINELREDAGEEDEDDD